MAVLYLNYNTMIFWTNSFWESKHNTGHEVQSRGDISLTISEIVNYGKSYTELRHISLVVVEIFVLNSIV